MKLLITAFDGSAGERLTDYIQQTMERPHVPLQIKFSNDFNIETDFIISVIRHPRDVVGFVSSKNPNIDLNDIIKQYEIYLKYVNEKSNMIVLYYDVINNIDQIIKNLFNTLNLDEQNYKNKTGRESLKDDVFNSIGSVDSKLHEKVIIFNSLDSRNEKLENANIEYDIAFNKAVKFDN